MNGRIIVGLLLILLGINFLFDINIFRIILPLILIYLGLHIIYGKDDIGTNVNRFSQASEAEENKIKRILVFSGTNQKLISKNFDGGEIVTIFGKADIDMREVKTQHKRLELNLVAIFGGINIIMPDNWTVHSEGVGVLGDFRNNSRSNKPSVDVDIKGTAIFGVVEINN